MHKIGIMIYHLFWSNKLSLVKQMSNTRSLFLKNQVVNKSPYNIFKKWYKNAQVTCKAESMYLTTVSKTNTPSCRVSTCIDFSKDGFKFPVTGCSQTSIDLKENINATIAFIWPQNRVVRIEGSVKISETSCDYTQKIAYNCKIIAACCKKQQLFKDRESLIKCLNNLKLKYPPNSNFDCNITVFTLIPNKIEFYQSKKNQLQERLEFNKGMVVDNNLIYEADEGWSYSILSP